MTLFTLAGLLLSRLPARLLAAAQLSFAGCDCQAAEAACVLVRVEDPEGSAGSGTVVACEGGRSLVVTNRHVVPSARYGVRVECQGKTYPVAYYAPAAVGDLALLTVEAELPCAELADAEPPAGAEVRQWGRAWRGHGRPVPKAGRWSGLGRGRDVNYGYAAVVESTIPGESGDSGAGVFHEGRLVAVAWGLRGGMSAGVRLADVRACLRDRAAALFPRLAERLRKPDPEPAGKAAPEAKKAAAPKPAGPKVTVYTRSSPPCPACVRFLADPAVKALLAEFEAEVVDISKTPAPHVRAVPAVAVTPPGGKPVLAVGAAECAALVRAAAAATK
jgi:hypothetical protein